MIIKIMEKNCGKFADVGIRKSVQCSYKVTAKLDGRTGMRNKSRDEMVLNVNAHDGSLLKENCSTVDYVSL
jgi:hypothetical protein